MVQKLFGRNFGKQSCQIRFDAKFLQYPKQNQTKHVGSASTMQTSPQRPSRNLLSIVESIVQFGVRFFSIKMGSKCCSWMLSSEGSKNGGVPPKLFKSPRTLQNSTWNQMFLSAYGSQLFAFWTLINNATTNDWLGSCRLERLDRQTARKDWIVKQRRINLLAWKQHDRLNIGFVPTCLHTSHPSENTWSDFSSAGKRPIASQYR